MKTTLVHANRVAEWGESLGDASLGDAIYNNSKLKDRAAKRMATYFGIDAVEPAPSLSPERGSLLSISVANQSQSLVVDAYLSHQRRFVTIAGLVRLGNVIRKSVTPEMFKSISNVASGADLKLAARVASQIGVQNERQLDTDRLGQMIIDLGEEAILAWRQGLSPKDAGKVSFALGEADMNAILSLDASAVTELMTMISSELQNEDVVGALS